MNIITIIGRLTKDIELRYTPSGTAVTTMSIAVNEGYGEKQKTYFFNAVVWDKQAENCEKFLSKGAKIAIIGALIQRSWEDKESGKKRSAVEIRANYVEFLETKKDQTVDDDILDLTKE